MGNRELGHALLLGLLCAHPVPFPPLCDSSLCFRQPTFLSLLCFTCHTDPPLTLCFLMVQLAHHLPRAQSLLSLPLGLLLLAGSQHHGHLKGAVGCRERPLIAPLPCRELKKTTGDWFYDQRVNRFANRLGSDIVRLSLRHKSAGRVR